MKISHPLVVAQDRLATVLGCHPDRRPALLGSMLHRGPAEVTGYWAQLLIAAGIGTLGLVLGSTAVIIGAMLVAPLMGPIVGLGMGLGAGSPVLVIRASVRTVASIIAVVTLSAGLTVLIPFHHLNAEIAARTTPTALDLGIAVFCAMAGVFATLRPSSDIATTAAGTSIGISLVPPLCVTGYGLGTGATGVAQGAGLLFLTNFAAIVFVASLAFAAAGFGRADVHRLESAELDDAPTSWLARPLARRVAGSLRSLGGPWLRLLMPFALIGALSGPLSRGLDEVAWQITARGNVDRTIAALPNRVVQAQVVVERRHIQVVIFLLGSQADALAARERLTREIGASVGTVPIVEVFAVPDSTEFEALERSTNMPSVPVAAPPGPPVAPPPPSLGEVVGGAAKSVRAAVESRWPRAAGKILRIDIDTTIEHRVALRVVHLGAALEPATIETLTHILYDDLGGDVVLLTEDVPVAPIRLDAPDAALVARVGMYVERARSLDALHVCFRPSEAPQKKARREPAAEARADALRGILAGHPGVIQVQPGEPAIWFTLDACDPAQSPTQ